MLIRRDANRVEDEGIMGNLGDHCVRVLVSKMDVMEPR